MSDAVESELRVTEAIKTAEEDAETLQRAIIEGHLGPQQNAAALAALQRQSLTNVRLLTIVGDGKFVTKKSIRPIVAVVAALGASVLTMFSTIITGRIS